MNHTTVSLHSGMVSRQQATMTALKAGVYLQAKLSQQRHVKNSPRLDSDVNVPCFVVVCVF